VPGFEDVHARYRRRDGEPFAVTGRSSGNVGGWPRPAYELRDPAGAPLPARAIHRVTDATSRSGYAVIALLDAAGVRVPAVVAPPPQSASEARPPEV
jgi:hypothetical protein